MLRGMLEGKSHTALHKWFPVVLTLTYHLQNYEKTACMTRLHKSYMEIGTVLTRDRVHCVWSEGVLRSLQGRVKKFKLMSEEAFVEHCECGLYNMKYH